MVALKIIIFILIDITVIAEVVMSLKMKKINELYTQNDFINITLKEKRDILQNLIDKNPNITNKKGMKRLVRCYDTLYSVYLILIVILAFVFIIL